jgi:tRNA modification GTPase
VWQGKAEIGDKNLRRMLLGKVGGDPTLAVYMKAPNSYTGDDVVELHCHGGVSASKAALSLILAAGCRPAEPGEFTFRAFVNGKLDLSQAEAVADLVSSGSESARKMAENQLAGGLSKNISDICDKITFLRSECEARLDFPDEALDFDDALFDTKLDEVKNAVSALASTAEVGEALRNGVPLVLAGAPNTGKSSLLNRLLGKDRAIVSDIPGTTRDIIESPASLRGFPVILSDTAGLRESDDPIERSGIVRSKAALESARIVFYLLDASQNNHDEQLNGLYSLPQKRGVIAVWNKCDLAQGCTLPEIKNFPTVSISALTSFGIDALLDAFEKEIRGGEEGDLPSVAVNARGAALLEACLEALNRAQHFVLLGDYEIAAAELAEAGVSAGLIIGRNADPDLLDEVFKNFCIGK